MLWTPIGEGEPERVGRRVWPESLPPTFHLLQMEKISSLPRSLSSLELLQTVGLEGREECHFNECIRLPYEDVS